MLQLDRGSSLTARAVQSLRTAIIAGDLPLGAQLSEGQLARDLGVSKTPVREALQQLRSEGLVRIVPQTGSFVFRAEPRELADLCELRMTLERAALRRAMDQRREALLASLEAVTSEMEALPDDGLRRHLELDQTWHLSVVEHGGNALLAEAYGNLAGRIGAIRTHLADRPDYRTVSNGDHRAMVEAIRSDDWMQVARLLTRHLDRPRTAFLARAAQTAAEKGPDQQTEEPAAAAAP